MCGGWIEKHKKELLGAAAIGGVLGAPAIASLLGGTAAAGAGAAGAAGAGEGLLAGGLGAGAAEELAGAGLLSSQAPGANALSLAMGNLTSQYGPQAARFGKAAALMGRSGLIEPQGPVPQMPAPPSGVAQMPPGQSAPSVAETHPTQVIDPETRRRRERERMLLAMYGRQ